jgi:hypothetical protein
LPRSASQVCVGGWVVVVENEFNDRLWLSFSQGMANPKNCGLFPSDLCFEQANTFEKYQQKNDNKIFTRNTWTTSPPPLSAQSMNSAGWKRIPDFILLESNIFVN